MKKPGPKSGLSVRGPGFWLAAMLACSLIAGCRSVIGVLVDIPNPDPTSTPGALQATTASSGNLGVIFDPHAPLAIESTLNPDSALALLPLDESGRVDWMEALRSGVIRPRSVLPGSVEPSPGFRPQFEVLFQAPDSVADAVFPHSPHVEWLACEQCHSPIRMTPIVTGYAMMTMTDVLQGEQCGECHGKVSFSPNGQVESCERCHPNLMPTREALMVASRHEDSLSTENREATLEDVDGPAVYQTWCAMCHGETGLGDGPLGGDLVPRPRDFTEALYQIRTTPSGELPTDTDLRRVIDEGIPGTAMPGWKNKLSVNERDALVAYLKTLSDYFDIPAGEPVAVLKPEFPATAVDLAIGRGLYDDLQCAKCHGPEGLGDGPSAATLTDDWGLPIKPANLSRNWLFNGGSQVEDIYTRLRTGLDGTPMPSLGDVVDSGIISEEQLWKLAQYVLSLSEGRTSFGDVGVRMRRVVVESKGVGVTQDLAPALFPHWLHRIRFQCKVCHTEIFEAKAGANEITMTEIKQGESCGACHNGVTAFAAGFGECLRCHVELPLTP